MQLSARACERVRQIFERAELGDPRRVRRAAGLAEALAKMPNAPLPRIWSSEAELEAGYRFLRNPRTDFSDLMYAIQQAARSAALEAERVLVIHDTTDVKCPSAEPEEVGFLSTGKAGFFVHHALCIAESDRRPLGVLWSQAWGRERRSSRGSRRVSGNTLAKLKERESDRWLEGTVEAAAWSQGCESVVHVMDREADNFRVFEQLGQLSADFVVRLTHNRKTVDGSLDAAFEGKPVRLRRPVALSRRRKKSAPNSTHKQRDQRQAKLEVRATSVVIKPPSYLDADLITLNVVEVSEVDAPKGEDPVQWKLATSLPIKTKRDIERVIDIYRARWVVEEFHKALKTGCMLEKRNLESFESLTTLLALSYPVACELLELRTRARDPHCPASVVLRPSLLQCLHAHPAALPLPDNPSAEDALLSVARIGGHLKRNGPPGWQTIGAGYKELLSFEAGWLAARATDL